jgi:hypothetical protein
MSVPKLRVVILYEDRLADDLHRLIVAMAHQRRVELGRGEPWPRFDARPMKGNSKLIKACGDFQTLRYTASQGKYDHVFAMIDAYKIEKVVNKVPRPPPLTANSEHHQSYRDQLNDNVIAHMKQQAFAGLSNPKELERESTTFHPHVLFWEAESILLAGTEFLREKASLEISGISSYDELVLVRHPYNVLADTWLAAKGKTYRKTDGAILFKALVDHPHHWPAILDRLPSLALMIEELATL